MISMRRPHLEQVRANKALPPEGAVCSMDHAPEVMSCTYSVFLRGVSKSATLEEALGL